MGLELINTGVNAFISAAYVVIVPFMVWIIEKSRPAAKWFGKRSHSNGWRYNNVHNGIISGALSMGKGRDAFSL